MLAETSITVEDVVFVVDTGRTKSTYVNEASLVSALRTCFCQVVGPAASAAELAAAARRMVPPVLVLSVGRDGRVRRT